MGKLKGNTDRRLYSQDDVDIIIQETVDECKNQLLKQLAPMIQANRHGVEAVAKTNILALPALMRQFGVGLDEERRPRAARILLDGIATVELDGNKWGAIVGNMPEHIGIGFGDTPEDSVRNLVADMVIKLKAVKDGE